MQQNYVISTRPLPMYRLSTTRLGGFLLCDSSESSRFQPSDWCHRIVRAFYGYQLFRQYYVERRTRPKAVSYHVIGNSAGIHL